MKKMKMFLLILSLSGFGFINAQNAQPEFSDIMTRAYTSLQDAESPQDLVNARNTMERISMKFTDQWLPVYYTSYVDIILSFVNENKETKLTYITEAKELVKKLNNYPDADKSEVSTLAGFALNAQVAADPENNGPALFGELIGAYKAFHVIFKILFGNIRSPYDCTFFYRIFKRLFFISSSENYIRGRINRLFRWCYSGMEWRYLRCVCKLKITLRIHLI
jgi:hypothetical protein